MNAAAETARLRTGADFATLPYRLGTPSCYGTIRTRPEDFIVVERLAFELAGAGEHLYLHVRKTGQNTRWVAQQLAQQLGLSPRSVGYAGMKDRHAVAEQWFSVHLPGLPDPDVSALGIEGVEVLATRRHAGKLRIGALTGNDFRLVVRDLDGDRDTLPNRLASIERSAVPNYFGPQRFGHSAGNLALFGSLEAPRDPGRAGRSLALSALRSALFNLYLGERLLDGSCARPLPGEIVHAANGSRYRHSDDCRDDADEWLPTGLLWGVGDNQATGAALQREQAFFAGFPATTALLDSHAPRMQRRPLLLRPPELRLGAGR